MSAVLVPDSAQCCGPAATFAELAAVHVARQPGTWLRVSFSHGRDRFHDVLLIDVADRQLVVIPPGGASQRLAFTGDETPPVWVWTLADQAAAETS